MLICPECQVEGWADRLDTCVTCGSTMLVKQLGVVSCRQCGGTVEPAAEEVVQGGATRVSARDEALSTEVADALDRVLGRSPADG